MKRMLTVLAVALMVAAMFVVTAMPAFAAITSKTTTKSGNDTQGHGNGLKTENVNPTGKAPPGQNQ